MMIKAPKKLIEVALPLDDINAAAAREKSIRHGHPSTLHLWWARRPLAAARAVLFAQLVNDPGGERGWGKYPGQTKEDAQKERERLFAIIRELVKWENTNNEELLEVAREEIRKSWRETCELNKGKPGFDPDKLPAFHDPFAGGGAIPLEAQRLGLEAYASDLNPVAVMINKAMIEIPPKFAGKAPVGPIPDGEQTDNRGEGAWTGAKGLAEDVRRYGHWMRKEAEKRIGHFYPKVKITQEMAKERPDLKGYVGRELTVIAWLWARTVKSPNPAYSDTYVPLLSSFYLHKKSGKEVYVEPIIDGHRYHFKVFKGKPKGRVNYKDGTKAGRGANFKCLISDVAISNKYIRSEALSGRMKSVMIGIVLEGDRERVYLSPTKEMEKIAYSATDSWKPNLKVTNPCHDVDRLPMYGMPTWGDAFTKRQLLSLNTFCDLAISVKEKASREYKRLHNSDDRQQETYGVFISMCLFFAISKLANLSSTFTSWMNDRGAFRETFARQAIPMVWDYAETNPFSNSGGNFITGVEKGAKAIEFLPCTPLGKVFHRDASTQEISQSKVISTDPPYYDNIGYAELSDFFYIWLRKGLKDYYPDIFSTISTPKSEELVASSHRHETKQDAEKFFLSGMTKAISNLSELSSQSYPITIYYAFKQSETSNTNTSSTGWETFLEAVLNSNFSITGTWPVRTEGAGRMIGQGNNALASSIVLVCRKRDDNAPSIPRRQFLRELKEELPEALEAMIGGKKGASPIAPVDLAQAAIGPGMAVFSRYSGIIEADGSKMSVHDALIQINKVIDEFFNEAEGDMDSDTRFCIDWFMQYGFKQAEYGQADVLARAKGTTVEGLAVAGVVETGGGKVRLLKFEEYPENWDPEKDTRIPTWEALHQLIRALRSGGEAEAGLLLKKMAERTESIRQLAYRLYTLCERKGWAEEARAYNELIASWHGTIEAAERAHAASKSPQQIKMEF